MSVRTLLKAAGLLIPVGFLAWFSFYLGEQSEYGASREWFILVIGVLLGVALQRSRFCFFCVLRDYFEKHDSRGVIGILAALAIGSVGYLVIFGGWVVDPQAGYLPPNAHIGPVSWVLPVGAVLFGWGMALSGSCISAHLYRLGEGSVLSPVALIGAFFGFWLGFWSWNSLYLSTLSEAEAVWIPAETGYGWALVVQLLLLALIFLWLIKRWPRPENRTWEPLTFRVLWRKVWIDRWPTWVGGLMIGALGIFAYLRFAPLGVTAQLGSLSRAFGNRLGVLPEKLEGLDGFSGCSTAVSTSLLNENGILVLGLVAGALFVGVLSGEFEIEKKHILDYLAALLGGLLLGFGAMISLGCTIGTLLSGVSAFAWSGWVYALFLVLGVWSGLFLRRRLFFWHQ